MTENPAAFPAPEQRTQYEDKLLHPRQPGMSLRDWFAGHARPDMAQSMDTLVALAGPTPKEPTADGLTAEEWDAAFTQYNVDWVLWRAKVSARLNYIYADAMLAEAGRK
jgi:hypothetical protein